jgi:CheY-like chemotaxis protein
MGTVGTTRPQLHGLDLLLVDDDEDVLELTALALRRHGASISTARDAREARRAFAAKVPHVIVCDLGLPEEDGCELVRSLRSQQPAPGVPAIALTGSQDWEALHQARAAGFQKHLPKPFEIRDLVSAIVSVTSDDRTLAGHPRDPRDAGATSVGPGPRGVLALLEHLNRETDYRFTSFYRFAADRLVSVWTYDREDPRVDLVPPVPVSASYCAYVRDQRGPFLVDDSVRDERVANHPGHGGVHAFCGVPVFDPDGRLLGSLCHYDSQPRQAPSTALARLAETASVLSAHFASNADA